MQIRVLGTVEAQVGDELVVLGPRQRRLVLGALGLWRGPVLASGIEETRLVAVEALLGLGGQRDAAQAIAFRLGMCPLTAAAVVC